MLYDFECQQHNIFRRVKLTMEESTSGANKITEDDINGNGNTTVRKSEKTQDDTHDRREIVSEAEQEMRNRRLDAITVKTTTRSCAALEVAAGVEKNKVFPIKAERVFAYESDSRLETPEKSPAEVELSQRPIVRLDEFILSAAAKKEEERPFPVQKGPTPRYLWDDFGEDFDAQQALSDAANIEEKRPFIVRQESVEETEKERIPLMKNNEKTGYNQKLLTMRTRNTNMVYTLYLTHSEQTQNAQSEFMQKKTPESSSPSKTSLRKGISYSEDKSKIALIRKAEEKFFTSSTSGHKVDEKTVMRYCDIATAIYLDDDLNLSRFLTNELKHSEEIQRRILEAVELNSLKCLLVLCDTYEKLPSTTEEDVHLFHRRYGLSSWPLNERPKESAVHLVANKLTSIKAMKVLEKHPRFLDEFSDIPDSHGSSPLLLAIKCNNMEVVKRLLARKPDLNKRNKHNETPILVAALNDDADVIKEMLEIYPETELLEIMRNIDGKGHSILYPASQSGKPEVLNLIMKRGWWPDFLDQEKKMFEKWESFVCNVCSTGCKELAETIFKQNPKLLEPEGDKFTPLMSAAKANQLEIVQLIFEFRADYSLFMTCDGKGRNVFHYSVENPDILRYLLEQYEKVSIDKHDVNKMDNLENTPIKLAAVRKLKESFKILLQFTTSEADIFSAHLIHNVDFEVLKMGLLIWKEKDPEAVACLLNGDHKQHQPFLEAAKKGNIQLMQFFLEQGANHSQRTPNDQTAIHYAVLSGKLAAVQFLLKKEEFLEMINFTDDVNITAAGYATQSGNVEILRYLLDNNAKMKSDTKTARLNILDCAYGYFKTGENSLKEIIRFSTRDGKIQILQELFEDSYFGADRIMSQLIEKTPDVAMMIFDLCVYQDEYLTHRSYGEMEVERRVSYSFFPFKRNNPEDKPGGKLEAIESMVNFRRDNCLGHPLVLRNLQFEITRNDCIIANYFDLLCTSFHQRSTSVCSKYC
ncbi:uncharacterized protein LOC114516496 isoform X2 [Dendronephthya gigantea]|uniref:uncharacterized protein LOC114516496 isoform X2 n=1 Tax=Dendronephthya gigantea TaxID=151771 RepID=UPI00106D81FC|nr:uncharacterized protein LOC114516496 isoform X2 [Dendronephthya gigantea]